MTVTAIAQPLTHRPLPRSKSTSTIHNPILHLSTPLIKYDWPCDCIVNKALFGLKKKRKKWHSITKLKSEKQSNIAHTKAEQYNHRMVVTLVCRLHQPTENAVILLCAQPWEYSKASTRANFPVFFFFFFHTFRSFPTQLVSQNSLFSSSLSVWFLGT